MQLQQLRGSVCKASVPHYCPLATHQYDALLEQVLTVHSAVHALQERQRAQPTYLVERNVHHDIVHQAFEQAHLHAQSS